MTALYVDHTVRAVGRMDASLLSDFTERHVFRIPPLQLSHLDTIEAGILDSTVASVVFSLNTGLPSRQVIKLARHALQQGRSVYFYWPAENAIEVIDFERLNSVVRHWLAYQLGTRLIRWIEDRRRSRAVKSAASPQQSAQTSDLQPLQETLDFIRTDFASTSAHIGGAHWEITQVANSLDNVQSSLSALLSEGSRAELEKIASDIAQTRDRTLALLSHMEAGETALSRIGRSMAELSQQIVLRSPAQSAVRAGATADPVIEEYRKSLEQFSSVAAPVPFAPRATAPTTYEKVSGTGVYVRTAYWTHLVSGGSYGHTCYVADELGKTTDEFICLMGSRFPLLDDLAIPQEVIAPPFTSSSEHDLLAADQFYYHALKKRLLELRPAYIYERLVLGNFAAARLSRELGIPYIVEYNGSEISMSRSFGAGALDHEELFLEAERLAFQQATVITAISEHVRDDIVRRGVDPSKVLTNPNGVNCAEYAPASKHEKLQIRAELGLSERHRVIAFIGTFGGWHGIDVLAASLAPICQAARDARFILIGDGNLKHLVIDAVKANGLQEQVIDIGRTEQRQGARYLRAADIYVSPHSSHMVDSKFFGSPTKLFEYMALGGGIVASDLEQIGVVLSPALRPSDFQSGAPKVQRERAVLCRSGDVDDFVAGVLALVRHPDVSDALGKNSRAAVEKYFSWERHVARIWDFTLGLGQEPAWNKGQPG